MTVFRFSLAILPFLILVPSVSGTAIPISLGSAGSFAVLAGSTVTNTGTSVVDGNVGVSPGSAITGFPPGIITAPSTFYTNAVATQAQADSTTAYLFAQSEPCSINLSGEDLGGLTLLPGSYCFGGSAGLTGSLTLNSLGDPDAQFLFQISSTLTTASNSSVIFINGGDGDNVVWQVGSSATLGSGTQFTGDILALTSISLVTGADITCGRALAQNGAVTMDTNDITINSTGCQAASTAVPEPAMLPLFFTAIFAGSLWIGRRYIPISTGSFLSAGKRTS